MNNILLLNACHWLTFEDLILCLQSNKIGYGFNSGPISQNILSPKQVHKNNIIEDASQDEEADGIFTKQLNQKIAIHTADCLPIFLLDQKQMIVMALHAGWRGLTSGIVQRGLNILKLDSDLSDIKMILGPSISPSKFEVEMDVVSAFESKELGLDHSQIGFCLTKGPENKWFADLTHHCSRPSNNEVRQLYMIIKSNYGP